MLQMFRFVHHGRVSASQCPGFQKFPPRLRDNARALAAAMSANDELEQRLARALECQVQSTQFDRFNEPEWVVMLALYSLYHDANRAYYVHTVTDETNRIIRENGERRFFTPKKVGEILNHSLGFHACRQGQGYRIDLSSIGRKIHSQAKAMGINRSDILHWANVKSEIAGEPCTLCSEFGMMMDHEGRRLLTLDEVIQESMPCTNCGLQSHHQQCPGCGMPRKAALRNSPGDSPSGV
jgi:hypothetical protein